MKIAFTICSINYLALAKVLLDSFKKYNPDYTFIIGLCDKKSEQIDYNTFEGAIVIEAEELHIDKFENMSVNYTIVELNTSIKPFFFNYIFRNYNAELVYYLDPDICFYANSGSIEKEIEETGACILITPHILTPIPLDGFLPQENIFLNYGIYNLGFLALKKADETFRFLEWWSERLLENCKFNVKNGFFVDQLPVNYVPLFFKNVTISRNVGLNTAYWNLHERKITFKDGKYVVNDETDLIFFHFSMYKPMNKYIITPSFTRFKMDDDWVIKKLYENYHHDLLGNDYERLSKTPCFYTSIREAYLCRKRKEELASEPPQKKIIRLIKRMMPSGINRFLERYINLK
jgi:hypothetical protein